MAQKYILLTIFLIGANFCFAQNTITLPASTDYHKSNFYKTLFGEHYRKEWHTPVTFNIVMLDTLEGGLTPYQIGGSRQTKSLRLRDKNNREYVLRSIDKSFGGALPEIARGTFIEDMADDQVTLSHPYGALVVAPLAEAAGILHTNPRIFYIPKQSALGNFSDSIGDALYLFEQRPDEDWSTAANFGNSSKIISTDKMLEKMLEDNDNSVDQKLFLRSRLFDMLIGDWGRHEDQWRWAKIEDGDKNIYKPIPRDRDNAFSKLDGALLGKVLPMQMQTFGPHIKDVPGFNNTARNLDHRFLNELTYEDWLQIATDLQARLSDAVIEHAVRQMPQEVYALNGANFERHLKSRRDNLVDYVKEYYAFLQNWGIDIPGTKRSETFVVKAIDDNLTEVSIFDNKKNGEQKIDPFYQRVFNNSDVKELRLYPIDGSDKIIFEGNTKNAAKTSIVKGAGTVEIVGEKGKTASNNISYYSANKEKPSTTNLPKNFATLHNADNYVYENFRYNKSGFSPIVYYNNADKIHVGLGYKILNQKWNKLPYASSHSFNVKYSIDQNGFSGTYKGSIAQMPGKWFTNLLVNYDQIRWQNYFGLGNNSINDEQIYGIDYYRIRSSQLMIEPSLERIIKHQQKITIAPFFQTINIIKDTERYQFKSPIISDEKFYDVYKFAGLTLRYVYQNVNDSILPEKGISLLGTANQTFNLSNNNHHFANLTGAINFYVPLVKNISLKSTWNGAHILSGTPLFYQYNKIGGNFGVRGVQRDRFQGNSTISIQNDLRYIANVRSYLYNGKLGIFGLYDIGRVWTNPNPSNDWHYGYGAGVLVCPFNKITLSVAYAKSKNETNLHLGLISPL